MRVETRNKIIHSVTGLGKPRLISAGKIYASANHDGNGPGVILYFDPVDDGVERRVFVYLTADEARMIAETCPKQEPSRDNVNLAGSSTRQDSTLP